MYAHVCLGVCKATYVLCSMLDTGNCPCPVLEEAPAAICTALVGCMISQQVQLLLLTCRKSGSQLCAQDVSMA
jgi:predicted aconitase with swiveling domain